ncbi:MAG: hypothetical protein IJZ16_06570 [Clostridia bacterium]|nr:hypothetical protein [Clostridia bacterium]
MAKKQLTPEEYREKAEKKAIKAKNFSNTFVSAIAVLLAVVITFSVVSTAHTFAETVKKNTVSVNNDVQQNTNNDSVNSDNSSPVTDDNTVSDVGGVDAPTDVVISDTPTDNTETPEEEQKQEGAFASTEEMVAYFNTSANKVKTDATKVVKNYEKRVVGELIVPDVLQSTAESLLKTYMTDDTEPIVYDTKEEIRENFLVPDQDYVSCLKASDVEKAECKDNGKEYVIYFKLRDEKNPKAGSGVGSVCDVIETHEVAEKAPSFLEEFSIDYYDCEVTATIDKATGRMTHAVYSTPLKLNVVVSLFGTHSATVGLTFIKDYSITY